MPEGRLFYVVGASGVGKDSLLDHVRARPRDHPTLVFAHRYVTRSADAGGENHVVLSDSEFLLRKRYGLFVMDWEGHGSRYGIGTEINYWLAMGLSVIVNGSRGYIECALKRYPDMTVIWVSAAPERVTTRLARRGRETQREIAMRPARGPQLSDHAGCRVVHISNDGCLETAGEDLLAVLYRNPK